MAAAAVLVLALLAGACGIALAGCGVLPRPINLFRTGSTANWLQLFPFVLFAAISLEVPRFFRWVFLPVFALMALYFPIGFNFGLPNAGQIVSALNTDPAETKEFLSTIPALHFAFPFASLALLFAARLIRARVIRKPVFLSKVFLIIAVTAVAWLAGDFRYLTQGWRYGREVIAGMAQIREVREIQPDWTVRSVHPRYKNYVLVVGESNRRDYMHAYGYPVPNTPFMESRGHLLDGFTSVADYTIPSIQKALTKTAAGEEVNYRKNLLDLANQAGFATAWFSNQGHIDKKGAPLTAIADKAQVKHWLKSGNDAIANDPDLDLLPLVEKMLSRPSERRFIVLHVMGSHSSVCERIHAPFKRPVPEDSNLEDAWCYSVTMRQTDYFLQKLDELMRSSGESYSILYFADHGVSHNWANGKLVMNHAKPANHHRDIPLYRVSSDDKRLTRYRVRRFSRNLTEGAAEWLGIATDDMPQPRNLFTAPADEDIEGVLPQLQQRRSDPALIVKDDGESGSAAR